MSAAVDAAVEALKTAIRSEIPCLDDTTLVFGLTLGQIEKVIAHYEETTGRSAEDIRTW